MNFILRSLLAVTITFCLSSISLGDGKWITTTGGAKLWNPHPQPNETCEWTGEKDADGYGTGRGLIIWYQNNKVAEVSRSDLMRGRSIGLTVSMAKAGTLRAWSATGNEYEVKFAPKTSTPSQPAADPARVTSRPSTTSRPSRTTVRAQSPSSGPTTQEVKETIDTIKSGVELYNEVKKVLPEKKAADLIVKSVSVASTKANGKAWDGGGGKPDLKVQIDKGIFGGSMNTGAGSNSTYASFNNKKLRVSEGDTITIRVYDQDAFSDDLAGSYEKKITAETLKQGQVTWSFDQVTSLVIEFEY